MTTAQLLDQAATVAERRDWAAAAHLLDGAPDTDEVLDRRGWYHSRAKNYNTAIEIFTVLQQRRPHDYRLPYMIGFQYYQQELWERALPYFDEALAHNPQHIKSMWRRAHALDALGRTNAALLAAGRIRQTWIALPTHKQDEDRKRYAQACHLIAKYQIAHDPAGAANLLRTATHNNPTDPYHQQQLANALLKAGEPQPALAAAIDARRLKPHDTVIELTYIACAAACRQTDDAHAALQRIERRCAGWSAVRAARLALDVDDPHLAVRLVERARRDRRTRGHPRVDELAAHAAQAAAARPLLPRPIRTPHPLAGNARTTPSALLLAPSHSLWKRALAMVSSNKYDPSVASASLSTTPAPAATSAFTATSNRPKVSASVSRQSPDGKARPPVMSDPPPDPATFPGALPSGQPVPYLANDPDAARRLLTTGAPLLPLRTWFHATEGNQVPSIVTSGLIPSCWNNGDSCIVFGVNSLDDLPIWRSDDWIMEIRSAAPTGQAKAWWVPPDAITGAWHHGTFTPRDQLPRSASGTAPIPADGCGCALADICREQQQRWRRTLSLR